MAAQTAFIVDANVARVLKECGRFDRTAWVRLHPHDARPDHLIRSLEDSMGEAHGEKAQVLPAQAGPASRLAPQFWWTVGGALAQHAPPDATIVVENPGAVSDASAIANLLVGWVGSSRSRRAVLLWHGRVPRRLRRIGAVVLDARQLLIDTRLARELLEGVLPCRSTARLLRLASRRAALVHDVLDVAENGRGLTALDEALTGTPCPRMFMDRLTRRVISRCTPDEREALALGVCLGYWHPSLDRAGLGGEEPAWPWLGPLEGGWWRVRRLWHRPLHRHVKVAASPRGQPFEHPSANDTMTPAFSRVQVSPRPAVSAGAWERSSASGSASPASGLQGGPTVRVRLLGRFDVTIAERLVDAWESPRGLALFKYLLTHRARPCTRDVLLDVFWPDVSPDQARNRFHVALSALRRSLRAASVTPIVVYRAGAYGLNPKVDLQVDVDEFETLVTAGGSALRQGEADGAIERYATAVALYRGDLLAETPYEDWAMLPRETLRVTYLDVLDRLAALYLARESLGPCITVAQLVLQQDPCREDAHRLLMRCYAQQGRLSEASRQFELCSRALATKLGGRPSPTTVEFYQSIRANRPE